MPAADFRELQDANRQRCKRVVVWQAATRLMLACVSAAGRVIRKLAANPTRDNITTGDNHVKQTQHP